MNEIYKQIIFTELKELGYSYIASTFGYPDKDFDFTSLRRELNDIIETDYGEKITFSLFKQDILKFIVEMESEEEDSEEEDSEEEDSEEEDSEEEDSEEEDSEEKVNAKVYKENDANMLTIKGTPPDGNCFYTSVYRSSIAKGVLDKMYDCITDIRSSCEIEFIKKFRDFLADVSKPDIEKMFDHFTQLRKDTESFNLFIESLSYSQQSIIKSFHTLNKFTPEFKEDFINKLQTSIKRDKIWASQLEVKYTENYLKEICGITLKIYHSIDTLINDKLFDIIHNEDNYKNTIYILNNSEMHYEYV